MHLAAWPTRDLSVHAAIQQADAMGLRLLSISRFSLQPLARDGLVFGFATASSDELRAGVKTLALALRAL